MTLCTPLSYENCAGKACTAVWVGTTSGAAAFAQKGYANLLEYVRTNFFRFECMNLSLEGKSALVCGSSQGIGYAIAEELALMGANCILLARNKELLEAAVAKLDATLRQAHTFHVVDFNNHEATRKLIQGIVAKRPVHILVNNSGGPAAGPIVDATEEQFIATFNQ